MDSAGSAIATDESKTSELLNAADRALTARNRRVFQGQLFAALCEGNVRRAEAKFGWGRRNVSGRALDSLALNLIRWTRRRFPADVFQSSSSGRNWR